MSLVSGIILGTLAALTANEVTVGPVPEAERERLSLSPFYEKHVSVGGLPIVSSPKVSDEGLREAAAIVQTMLAGRDDIREALIRNRVRVVVMASSEQTTDIPEHSDLKPKEYWDRRARGLGATQERPAISCGEENLLNLPGDRYDAENILVHEFAHTIHEMGISSVDPDFDGKLRAAYDAAIAAGLWKDAYAATNHKEYWAEGVQSYFDTNRESDDVHNHVDTRAELAEYDPRLYALIDSEFRGSKWRYERYDARHPKAASR